MTAGLRAFGLAFLAWHFGRLFPGLAEPAVLAVVAVAGLGFGSLLGRLRAPLAVMAAVAFGWMVPTLGATVVSWFHDTLPLAIDRQAVFAAPGWLWGCAEGWLFTGRPDRRGFERLGRALALTAVFWGQGAYHITLYPHPLGLALAMGLFLATELILLAGPQTTRLSWAALALVVAAGVGVLWGLLGRYEDQATAGGGGLMKPDLFQFDFAPLVRLEEQIHLGEDLVLLYREEGPAQQRYLRRMVLDRWDPQAGFGLSSPQPPAVGRRPQSFPVPKTLQNRTAVTQEYYLVNIDPSSFFGLNEPTRITPFARWDGSSFVNAYRVESQVVGPDFWDLDAWEGVPAGPQPGGDDPELKALARQITAGRTGAYEQAAAIEQYLRENYYYSLQPGPPGPRGALKHFLFENKKGYCSYFAFAMTLLMRSLDRPARVAVGFATDPGRTVLGFNPVRAYQAHAWVEVEMGPFGWVSFDPTSDVPAPGEPFQQPKADDPAQLKAMITEILQAQPKALTEGSDDPTHPREVDWAEVWAEGRRAFPWVILVLALAANELWRWRWALGRRFTGDPRLRVRLWIRQVRATAARAGARWRPDDTPEAWARHQDDPGAAAWARQTAEGLYAPQPAADNARLVARASRALVRRLDRRRRPVHRALGTLFPWWPR